jgi:predicted phage terminase large subunit-like protein
MEEVFMQDVIRKEISSASGKAGRHIPIMGDKRKKADKYTRIECLLEPLHRNGQLYLNAKEQDNPNMKRLEEQFTAFGPGSRAHDDGPDAVEGAIWLIQDKFSLNGSSGFHLFAREENNKRF